MARFFMGGGGKKNGSDKKASGNAGLLGGIKSESLQKAMKHAKKLNDDEARYQQLVKEKMDANKSAFMGQRAGANKVKGQQGQEEKAPSKATLATLEIMAMRMAKKQMRQEKKRGQPVEIKAGYLGGMQGGHIDKKGRIFNAYNQQVLQVDLKSGKIKTVGFFGGSAIGKYDPKSSYCMYKISKKIEEFNLKKGIGGGTVWGNNDASSLYGSSPFNNDDKGGGNGW